MNVYKMSLTFLDENTNLPISVPKSVFSSVASRFIGESRQTQSLLIENTDPDTDVIRSYPISIHDIQIKQYTQTPQTKAQIVLRCLQGCDVTTLLKDMETSLKQATRSPVSIIPLSVERSEHCGLPESSPMCIDTEWVLRGGLTPRDIHNLEFIHNYVAPWFLLNEITMLKHLSVAYFENHSGTPALY